MGEDIKALKDEIAQLKKTAESYEKILKLNEKELENADEIIRMYEGILEYARLEMKDLTEVAKVREELSKMSRNELLDAIKKIEDLEAQNKDMKEKKKFITPLIDGSVSFNDFFRSCSSKYVFEDR